MNWGKNEPPMPMPPPPPPEVDMLAPRSAVPPQCPRCEVTKAQFNRTIQNYQKAFRKKVEGMKSELKSVRNEKNRLQKRVDDLSSPLRLHLPSLALGGLLVFGVSKVVQFVRTRKGGASGTCCSGAEEVKEEGGEREEKEEEEVETEQEEMGVQVMA